MPWLGTGGDELFGGYRSFRDLPASRRITRALRPLPDKIVDSLAWLPLKLMALRGGELPPQTRWGKLADLLRTRGDPVALYQVAYGLYTREFLATLAAKLPLAQVPAGLPASRKGELGASIAADKALAGVSRLELALFLGERLLRDTDVASMAASLEVRVPLLDHRVVEAAQAVPAPLRFLPLGQKSLLKSLAMPALDLTMFDRPKAGFVLPIELWAKDQLAGRISRPCSASASWCAGWGSMSKPWAACGGPFAAAPPVYTGRASGLPSCCSTGPAATS